MASWRIFADKNVDQQKVRAFLAENGCFVLKPTIVTRMENRKGLLCYKDEELCFIATGPDELDETKFKQNKLINGIEKSTKYSY